MTSLETTLANIRQNIEKYNNSPLALGPVTVLAASKGQTEATIQAAIRAGITVFGENRVQEAESKWSTLRQRHAGIELHLIGPLQTNKAKQAVALFDAIQTVDRLKLAESLKDAMDKLGKQIPCYIQVNTGKEPQKAGILPEQADTLVAQCRDGLGLTVAGLMCIPPADQPPAPHFALLRAIALRNGLNGLSMGMSDDYLEAVRMGSTCIRLGRALFGERQG